MFPPMKVFGNAGGPDHVVPLPRAALSGRTFEIMGGDGTRYVAPETFDEWLAGLDNRPPGQRPGQWAVNTLTPELWTAVNGTPFDAYHIGERLPDLIRYARHWWGVMEVSKDGIGIMRRMAVALRRGMVPSDSDDCSPMLNDRASFGEQIMTSCLLQPTKPSGHRWTIEELTTLLGAPPTLERFDRGYVIAFVETAAAGSAENLGASYAARGERAVSGPAVIMHMDETPAAWWAEYTGEACDG